MKRLQDMFYQCDSFKKSLSVLSILSFIISFAFLFGSGEARIMFTNSVEHNAFMLGYFFFFLLLGIVAALLRLAITRICTDIGNILASLEREIKK